MCWTMVTSISSNLSGRTVFIPVILIIVSVGSAGAVTSVTSCGTLSSPDVYELTQNISSGVTCIKITSSDVIFDGQGYIINGKGRSGYAGIYVYGSTSAITNVTVKNVTVINEGKGIRFSNVENSTIRDNTVNTQNTLLDTVYGIQLISTFNISIFNNIVADNLADNNAYGIILYYSSNNTISNNNVSYNRVVQPAGPAGGIGISLYFSNYNTIANNTAINNSNVGIRLKSYSIGNTITDNTALNHNDFGIYTSENAFGISLVQNADNNTITGNNASEHNLRGIYVRSLNNIITNNTANNNNKDGIYLNYYSNYNILSNNTANNNNHTGLHFDYSLNNTVSDNIFNNNTWHGMNFHYSNYSDITNNIVTSNGIVGINLGGFTTNNTIYNNFFNNTINYGGWDKRGNFWNTTKTLGTNIKGGPYLGGNFWATPDGTGYSETCTDADNDGFCDSNYILASGNVDYLPLSPPPVLYVTTTVIQRLDYYFNISWTIPPDPDLEEFNIYQRLDDNSSTDTLIDTVPANYTLPYITGPGFDDGNLYQYMVTPVNTSGSEGSGAFAPRAGPAPPIPFAPLGTLLTLGSGLAAYMYYTRKRG